MQILITMRRSSRQLFIKTAALGLIILALSTAFSPGAQLFSDNFNTADTPSLDGSDQTGRRTGILANDVVSRSGGIQHSITNGQLDFLVAGGADGRVRFHDANNLGNLWDFASGPGGAQILADGGFRMEFDWTPANNAVEDWISFSVGNNGLDAAFRVAQASTDFGILFRNNGGTQLFDNGAAVTGPSFDVSTVRPHHAALDYRFTSFADGSNVNVSGSIDGVFLGATSFQWDGNGGVLNIELGNLAQGTKLDNISLISVPEPSGPAMLGIAGLAALRRRRSAHGSTR